MPNVDRATLPFPVGVLAIHKPAFSAPFPSGYTPSFSNVGLVPGSVLTLGTMTTPVARGKLEVPAQKLDIIKLPYGCAFVEVEGLGGETNDLTTFRAGTGSAYFVIERHEEIKTLYDAVVVKGQCTLHFLDLFETIQLRAGDIIVSWKPSHVDFSMGPRNVLRDMDAEDMLAVIPVLPELPGVDCRAALLGPHVLTSIWQGVYDYMQCWQFMNVGGRFNFTFNQAKYDAYVAALPSCLLALDVCMVGQKRKLRDVPMVDSDDESAAKKAKV
jgi:hypothetical protein